MTNTNRIHSIDIMKGILILMMLFVNDIFLPDLPPWLTVIDPDYQAYGFAGWVFPAFIFMLGMTVPLELSKKTDNGLATIDLSKQTFSKALILITIGVLMVNGNRVDPQMTGLSKYLWTILMVTAAFLVWNRYPDNGKNFFTTNGLRLTGLAVLVFLVFRFRSGLAENNGSLITGWWEVPGLAGWGFLSSAFTYIAFKKSITGTAAVWLTFLLLNIFSQLRITDFLDPARPYIGVIIDGNIPFIIISGHLTTLIIKRFSENNIKKAFLILSSIGTISIISGIILLRSIFETGVYQNPAISLLVNGICTFSFLFFFWLTDIRKHDNWFELIKPAGQNPFTVYLIALAIFNLLIMTRIPLFFYRESTESLIYFAGSGLLTILMLIIGSIVVKFNIKLKI